MEIRRSYDRLISIMGFPILVRHLYIESGHRILLLLTYALCSWLFHLHWDNHMMASMSIIAIGASLMGIRGNMTRYLPWILFERYPLYKVACMNKRSLNPHLYKVSSILHWASLFNNKTFTCTFCFNVFMMCFGQMCFWTLCFKAHHSKPYISRQKMDPKKWTSFVSYG